MTESQANFIELLQEFWVAQLGKLAEKDSNAMRESKDPIKDYYKEYLQSIGRSPETPEMRIVVELNDISTMLAEIAIALKRIAPYFEERTIDAENKTEFERAE